MLYVVFGWFLEESIDFLFVSSLNNVGFAFAESRLCFAGNFLVNNVMCDIILVGTLNDC